MRRKKHLTNATILAPLLCAPLLFASCGGGPAADGNGTAPANNSASAANASATPAPTDTPMPAPSRQVVTATVEEATLDAGGAGEAVITLDIAEGYHVNANPASDKFYRPTEVIAEPQEGVTPGRPAYPKAVTRKLTFSDKPLSVYEGRAVIRLPLRADRSAAKGRHTLKATVRVQPCNDEACLQPRTIDAAIPVTIN